MNPQKALLYRCADSECERVARILKENQCLDLTYYEGDYFVIAVKDNNIEILMMLLKYYRKHKLQGDSNSLEYKVAKYKLIEVLKNALNWVGYCISDEMKNILSQYIPIEEDSESEQDLEELDELIRLKPSYIHDQTEDREISDA